MSAPLVLEPGLHLLQPDEAAHQQAGTDEQDERERDFAPHEQRCAAGVVHGCGERDVLARSVRLRSDAAVGAPGRARIRWPSARVTASVKRQDGGIDAEWRPRAAGWSGPSRRSTLSPRFRQHQSQDSAAAASTRLSVASCRTRRRPPAPSAARSAISCCRAVDRASSRFATLAQAMSSTNTTAPRSAYERRLGVLDDVVLERNDPDAHVGRSRARRAPAGAAGRCRPSRPAPARASRPA